MLGGLAVAYGFQMYPALLGNLYYKRISKTGVTLGLIAGLIAVTFTDKMASLFLLPWGPYPLTIHSAGWGIFFNILFAGIGSYFFPDSIERKKIKEVRRKTETIRKERRVKARKKKLLPCLHLPTLLFSREMPFPVSASSRTGPLFWKKCFLMKENCHCGN